MPVLSNARWERFAQELAKGKTQDEAYKLAGYKPNAGNASRLKGNDKIADRVREILGKVAKKTEVTIETIAAQLDEDRSLAHAAEQAGAAVSATLGKAKLYGLLAEKHEHSGPNGAPIQTEDVSLLTPTERQQRLAALLVGKTGA
jgi:hypothetical protein